MVDQGSPTNDGAQAPVTTDVVTLSAVATQDLITRKVTCPFLASAIAAGQLAVRNSASAPLASVADVTALGNTGGGDLGAVLRVFAEGNHAFLPGPAGAFDVAVPPGHFSLDLPGSQGSHPGHSGILQGDPNVVDSGRFSQADLDRLTARSRGGLIRRSDIGRFIAANLKRDSDARVFSAGDLISGIGDVLRETPQALLEGFNNLVAGTKARTEQRELIEKLTRNARASNLVGSSGEFALMLAFLEHKPGARTLDGEPAVLADDVVMMFRDKVFPTGWETWPKHATGWIANTLALVTSASGEFL